MLELGTGGRTELLEDDVGQVESSELTSVVDEVLPVTFSQSLRSLACLNERPEVVAESLAEFALSTGRP